MGKRKPSGPVILEALERADWRATTLKEPLIDWTPQRCHQNKMPSYVIVMSTDVERFARFCDSEFGKSIMKKEVEYVYNELRNCEEILDVGCGIGSFEENLSSLNIVGLDSS